MASPQFFYDINSPGREIRFGNRLNRQLGGTPVGLKVVLEDLKGYINVIRIPVKGSGRFRRQTVQ